MRTAVTRALGGIVVVATLVSVLSACTGDDGSSTPTPEPSSEPTTSPTEPVDLTFGVFGSNEDIQAYTAMANNFTRQIRKQIWTFRVPTRVFDAEHVAVACVS